MGTEAIIMFALFFLLAIVLMAVGIAFNARLNWKAFLYVVPVGLAIAVLVWVIVPKVGW